MTGTSDDLDADELIRYLETHYISDAEYRFGFSKPIIMRAIHERYPGYSVGHGNKEVKDRNHAELEAKGLIHKPKKRVTPVLDVDSVRKYFRTHGREDTARHFGVTEGTMRTFLKKHGIRKSREEIAASRNLSRAASKGKSECDGLDPHEVGAYYDGHTRKETASRFNVSEDGLRRFLKTNGLQRSKPGFKGDPRTDRSRKASLDEYYGDGDAVRSAHDKARATMRDRYGDENYNVHKAFDSYKERTGYDNPLLNPDVTDARERTLKERYGVGNSLAVPELRDKAKRTNMERYGAENPLGNGSLARERRDETMIGLYGDSVPLRVAEFKYAAHGTLMDHYGVPNPGLVHAAQKESMEEMSLVPLMEGFGLSHNDMTGDIHSHPYFIRLSDGYKCPDFFDPDRHIAFEYNGSYWHQDPNEPESWLREWSALGWRCGIVWDFERKRLINDPPSDVDALLSAYPCSFRTS